ncbi:MAG TPA: type II toxin-antitoxin system VapC family toxin [Bryobacteraceae bacterium]
MPGFWDASAIAPLCVPAQNAGHDRQLLHQHAPVVWWGTAIEVVSALVRLRRQNFFTEPQYYAAYKRFTALRRSWREIQPTNRVRDLCEIQLDRYDLRAADGLQLAAALVWCNQRPKNRPFLCRDIRLRAAARSEGFLLVDP